MDAWWPRLVEAEFKPTLGQALFDQTPFGHDAPGRLGSAFNSSSYGYVQKDLRDLLGASVQGPYSRVYCGQGQRRRLPHRVAQLARATRSSTTPTPSIYGGQTQVRARQDRLQRGRRDHPAEHPLGQPPDLPAGGPGPGPQIDPAAGANRPAELGS